MGFAYLFQIGESRDGSRSLPRHVQAELPNFTPLRTFLICDLLQTKRLHFLMTAGLFHLAPRRSLGRGLFVESAFRLRAMASRVAVTALSRDVSSTAVVPASCSSAANSLRSAAMRASRASRLRCSSRSLRSLSCWRARAAA